MELLLRERERGGGKLSRSQLLKLLQREVEVTEFVVVRERGGRSLCRDGSGARDGPERGRPFSWTAHGIGSGRPGPVQDRRGRHLPELDRRFG